MTENSHDNVSFLLLAQQCAEPPLLPRGEQSNGIEIFRRVDPAFLPIDADLYPYVLAHREVHGLRPLLPLDENLGSEDFNFRVLLDHHVRRRPVALARLAKQAYERQLLFLGSASGILDGQFATLLGDALTRLVHAALRERELACVPVDTHGNRD